MKRLYPFNEWFTTPEPTNDGKRRFILTRGQHYTCSQSSMVMQLRVAATHCGVRISITDMENSLSVVVAPKLVKVTA